MERKLLIIDDDYQRMLDVKAALSPEILTQHAFNIQDASRLISKSLFSVIVIIPAENQKTSYQFLSDLRDARPMPIIMAGISSAEDRALAYRLGADQCINPPVTAEELTAAIIASLRRYYELNMSAQLREPGMSRCYKDLRLDPQRRSVTMRGQPVTLVAKEFDVLYFLMCNPGIVLSKDTIYAHVWREEHPYGSQSVADQISGIRKKLGLLPQDKGYIETVYNVGYRFSR